jgi:hypothetical protein
MRVAAVTRRTVFTSEQRRWIRIVGVKIDDGMIELNEGEARALSDWLLLNLAERVSS